MLVGPYLALACTQVTEPLIREAHVLDLFPRAGMGGRGQHRTPTQPYGMPHRGRDSRTPPSHLYNPNMNPGHMPAGVVPLPVQQTQRKSSCACFEFCSCYLMVYPCCLLTWPRA